MNFKIYETPVGNLKIGYLEDEIIYFKKIFENDIKDYGVETELTKTAYEQLIQYLNGKRKVFDLPCKLIGTEFQIKVWNELARIPYGETRTYKEVAKRIGNEEASRAIGNANNKNPITIIYPCHRVIGSNKKLIGYAGGLDMKEKLLKLEQDNKN